jgi:3-phenylpropionate/trans-cinnamate dioxygenase ferredoxin reductase subunit
MRVLIVGGGLAAARAAESARESGFDGDIAIVGKEPHLPYQRPPLSKEALVAPPGDELWVLPPSFYADNAVELVTGRRAVRLDPVARKVELDDRVRVGFDRLLVATGSRPRRLQVPGADLAGIHRLRTLDDSRALAVNLAAARDVVIVGAGLIGLEVAATARSLGKRVTVLEAAAVPLARLLGPTVGDLMAGLHRDAGVDLRLRTEVGRFLGRDTVEEVELTDGSRLPADLVLVGIGARPNTEWLEGSGLDLAHGVRVDGQLATALPGVFAAGDVACTWVPLYQRHVRLEHYGNADAQGRAAGRALAGLDVAYAPVPGASSTQFGRRLQVSGLVLGDEHVVLRRRDDRFTAFYVREGRLAAVAAFDMGRDFLAARKLVATAARVDLARLADVDAPLAA